jgi:hypothetical protein
MTSTIRRTLAAALLFGLVATGCAFDPNDPRDNLHFPNGCIRVRYQSVPRSPNWTYQYFPPDVPGGDASYVWWDISQNPSTFVGFSLTEMGHIWDSVPPANAWTCAVSGGQLS